LASATYSLGSREQFGGSMINEENQHCSFEDGVFQWGGEFLMGKYPGSNGKQEEEKEVELSDEPSTDISFLLEWLSQEPIPEFRSQL
jgi:hypothetical protein